MSTPKQRVLNVIKQALILVFITFLAPALAANIFKADRHFTEKEYGDAKTLYLEAAELGNPHAYYQLANMYSNGFGVEKDTLKALLYFYLAAEQDFHNSNEVLKGILDKLPEQQKDSVLKVLESYKASNGQDPKNKKYFPEINQDYADTQFTFDGAASLKTIYYSDDFEIEDFISDFDNISSLDTGTDDSFESSPLLLIRSTPRTPFLVLDHDIEKDGSVRYTREVQKFGNFKPLLEQFKLFPISKPEFNKQYINFASRSYLGTAAFNKFDLIRENEEMYGQIIKQTRKFSNSDLINDQFNLAMLMLNFKWLTQEENEAEEILLKLASKGHFPAMYEYGFKLYREQRDVEKAIYWISEASKYGLERAEYRLARILQSSPWVVNDERKALFWFQSAMKKDNKQAKMKATEILFTSQDESLANYALAVEYLNSMSESSKDEPEYFYLNALKYKSGTHRNIKLAVENLETAILRAQMNNWDVSDWEELLSEITTGNIFVTDYENNSQN